MPSPAETVLAPPADEDYAALHAAAHEGAALCTIVGIEGSFSRRLGAQLAILPDGETIGSLADGCLERQLASDVGRLSLPKVQRYGRGSPKIDFRLPCGGGLDILLDPHPDISACREALAHLAHRRPAQLLLPSPSPLPLRQYIPKLAIRAFGEGPELAAFEKLAGTLEIAIETHSTRDLSLGRASGLPMADRWTAIVMLFHDHEWEQALLEEALASNAFFIGAQGGERAREARINALLARGMPEETIARIHSPIGLLPACKSPSTLALSALTQIVGEYERLRNAP